MDLAELCRRIELPAGMTDRVLTFDRDFDQATIAKATHNLLRRATWEQAIKDIQGILGDDPAGVKILACLLRCACKTHQTYSEKGIPEIIFIDTMKFFSRFVNFHQAVYGFPAFTWGWWVPRQLSLNEFRIGSLEYETVESATDRKIHIHIASDSDLTLPRLRESYLNARKFFADYFPAYARADMICESWMLCPVLHELLPVSSRVLAFQRSFEVYKLDPENNGFLQWVYGRKDTPFTDLPETTSLQRNMKTHLLQSGKIGWAHGKLVQNPFNDC
jgi:hypothetical protein